MILVHDPSQDSSSVVKVGTQSYVIPLSEGTSLKAIGLGSSGPTLSDFYYVGMTKGMSDGITSKIFSRFHGFIMSSEMTDVSRSCLTSLNTDWNPITGAISDSSYTQTNWQASASDLSFTT